MEPREELNPDREEETKSPHQIYLGAPEKLTLAPKWGGGCFPDAQNLPFPHFKGSH